MSKELILVLNYGSSSIKFSIIHPNTETKYISGIAECLNLPEASIQWNTDHVAHKKSLKKYSNHNYALNFIVNVILPQKKTILQQICGIGHRIVHGGKKCTKSVIINEKILENIRNAIPFAPLHNPAHLIGIQESFKIFPNLIKKNVAVFDTAFHQTMPEESYLYAIPYSFYKNYDIRRYGAHGISHYYVSHKAAEILEIPIEKSNFITCHLGNGGSVAAILHGKCVDTSMGLTPLEGLVMGTRCGDIDPAIIFYLNEKFNIPIKNIRKILSEKSGLLGLTQTSSDFRYVEKNFFCDPIAERTMKIYCHRLTKYIGAYSTLMNNKLDGIVFTGGIGENACNMRELSIKKLQFLGFFIDIEKNLTIRLGKSGIITKKNSRPVLVIPTNEELVIAQETFRITGKL
ncbi:acetate kinase A and propionate kinase 2 [Wigglesworthia glossinidia endosymbiont of Glossina morsitans morsitans (Yale colony)]|uniref:Acetate kinase n=1 Tax=Wigglesworthia glossinidia endosymbiont of Glossina morsitans morsitans (Yale colony) TaxID=1142511 RepID=H6Q5D3_WIGGL|nr:acetate kinase [Wigglesworthia glossinidia]AFA41416.1 acetate kinase A and propionate kinase 2 [Wigglesworthia glossinidia endosymbiont of Glossina morsitans morsitans (Yale colony)]